VSASRQVGLCVCYEHSIDKILFPPSRCSGERPVCAVCKGGGLDVCIYVDTIRRRGPGRRKLAAIEDIARNQSRRGVRDEDRIFGGYPYSYKYSACESRKRKEDEIS
jgi:hypothetical protein